MRSLPKLCALFGLMLVAGISSCKDEVVVVIPVASVEITGATTLLAGSSGQFTAIPRDDRGNRLSGRTIQWSTSNGNVATAVSSGGENATVTAALGGMVTVTARCEGASNGRELTVNNPVPVVNSTEPTIAMAEAGAFQLTVHGSGFVPTSDIYWAGAERATTYVNPTSLRATV